MCAVNAVVIYMCQFSEPVIVANSSPQSTDRIWCKLLVTQSEYLSIYFVEDYKTKLKAVVKVR